MRNGRNGGRDRIKKLGENEEEGRHVSLARQKSHHIPVSGENTELHQVAENTENLQQELLERWIDKESERSKYITISLMSLN